MTDPRPALKVELTEKISRIMRLPNSARAMGMMNDYADKLLQYKANRRRPHRKIARACE